MKRAACMLLVAALVPSALAQTWTPETLLQVKLIGDVRVAPDGSRVVYTVGEAVMSDDSNASKSRSVTLNVRSL